MNPPPRSEARRTRTAAPENFYQAATTATRMRGGFYTPPPLVRRILEQLQPGLDALVLDPACGDGEFLVGAVEYLAGTVPDRSAAGAAAVAAALAGFDVDAEAVAEARRRVAEALRRCFRLRNDELPGLEERIHVRDALELPNRRALEAALPAPGRQVRPAPPRRLVLAGNPPYVEAKRLRARTRSRLKAAYPFATGGAPDLYLYFLTVCLNWLEGEDAECLEDDVLGLVVPNRLLVNANARAVRERLLAGRLRGIDFATRAGLFTGAAVYPVVLYAGPALQPEPAPLLAQLDGAGAPVTAPAALVARPLPRVRPALFRATESRAIFPPPRAPEAAAVLERLIGLLSGPPPARLEEVLDIRWSLSFHRAGLREQFILRQRPNLLYAYPILGGAAYSGNGEVARYSLRWDGWWMDYDEERLRRAGNPLPSPTLFSPPKVVICQNGRTLRAAFDPDGFVLKDTFLCGLPRHECDHPLVRHPRALVGLLCSRAVHFYYSHVFFGSHVNGGYLHFLRSFLNDIPLGRWSDETAASASALVARRAALGHLHEGEATPAAREAATRLEEELEQFVAGAWGLDDAEQQAIASWAAGDENWLARERIRRAATAAEEPL